MLSLAPFSSFARGAEIDEVTHLHSPFAPPARSGPEELASTLTWIAPANSDGSHRFYDLAITAVPAALTATQLFGRFRTGPATGTAGYR